MDAFDADVLIYAAVPDHHLGRHVRALFPGQATTASGAVAGIGSVLLIPELLTKPLRDGAEADLEVFDGPACAPRPSTRRPGHRRTRHRARSHPQAARRRCRASRDRRGRWRRPVHHEQLLGLHEDHLRGRYHLPRRAPRTLTADLDARRRETSLTSTADIDRPLRVGAVLVMCASPTCCPTPRGGPVAVLPRRTARRLNSARAGAPVPARSRAGGGRARGRRSRRGEPLGMAC